jgi:hypothetical protein
MSTDVSEGQFEKKANELGGGTGYGLNGRFSIPCGDKVSLYSIVSRPALGPTQSPT